MTRLMTSTSASTNWRRVKRLVVGDPHATDGQEARDVGEIAGPLVHRACSRCLNSDELILISITRRVIAIANTPSLIAGPHETGSRGLHRSLYDWLPALSGGCRASWRRLVSSSESEVLMTVPPYCCSAATALSGVACSMTMNRAEVPGLT